MSSARIGVLVVWGLALASFLLPAGLLRTVGFWLFWLMAIVHAVECVVFLPRLRAAGGSLAGQLGQTFVFGMVHMRELGARSGPAAG